MKKKLSDKTKLMIGIVVIVVMVGSAALVGVIRQRSQSRSAIIQVEKNKLHNAEAKVKIAYNSRSVIDITAANKAILQLDSKIQKPEIDSLKSKMSKLKIMLAKLEQARVAISRYKTSRKEEDAKSTQSLIDKLTEDYLSKDKKKLQAELEDLKKEKTAQSSSKSASSAANQTPDKSSSAAASANDSQPGSAANPTPAAPTPAPAPAPAKAQVTISAGYTQTCTITAGQSLLSVITQQMGAQVTSTGFVTAVGGLSQDPSQKKYIMFKINGVLSPVGVGSVFLQNGDQVEFYIITM